MRRTQPLSKHPHIQPGHCQRQNPLACLYALQLHCIEPKGNEWKGVVWHYLLCHLPYCITTTKEQEFNLTKVKNYRRITLLNRKGIRQSEERIDSVVRAIHHFNESIHFDVNSFPLHENNYVSLILLIKKDLSAHNPVDLLTCLRGWALNIESKLWQY